MAEIEERSKPLSVKVRKVFPLLLRHENSVLGLILALIVGIWAGISRGASVTVSNFTNILSQSSIRGVAAVGQTMVMLSAGIDLSVGGLALMTSVLGAQLMTGTTAFPAVPLLVAALAGLGIGAINGLLVSRVGVPALIVTLAMWQITRGVGFLISGGRTITYLPPFIFFLGRGHIAGMPMVVVIFVVVCIVGYFVLHHASFGCSLYAVGGNYMSAWLSGISVKNIILSVYVISGGLAALAGLMLTARLGSASLAAAIGLELDSVAAVCLGGISLMGGRGTLLGAIIGVIILGVINNGMNIVKLGAPWQLIVKGVIIIVAVAVDVLRRGR